MRLLRSATWPTASVDPLLTVPVRRSTLSCWSNFSDLRTATGGLASSSSNRSSNGATSDTARPIDLLDGELGAPTHLFSDRSVAARQRRDHPDLDRLGCVRGQSEAECECDERTA